MQSSQPTKTKKGLEKQAATLGDSTLPLGSENMVSVAQMNSLLRTPATTLNGLSKTWTSAELEVLRSKASLVAGALADFQAAGGLVVVKKVVIAEDIQYPKITLVARGLSINVIETVDGIEFDLVAVVTK